jgi:hypothetical protein
MQAGRLTSFFLFPLLVCLTQAGCRTNNADLLENELRARDIQFREAIDELKKSEFQKEALQREVESLRRGTHFSPEAAAQIFGLKRITLGRGTSAIDTDNLPGDDGLQVVFEPRDADDHIVKTPGTLEITALEINAQGTKTILSTWAIDQEQLRRSWKQSLFSTGYILTLPWKSWPQTENLRVVARLTLPDARVFETDRDVKLRLPAGPRPLLPAPKEVPFKDMPSKEIPPKEVPLPLPKESTRPGPPEAKSTVWQANWQPAPLNKTINLGRPEPIDPPPPVQLLGLTEDSSPLGIWSPRE